MQNNVSDRKAGKRPGSASRQKSKRKSSRQTEKHDPDLRWWISTLDMRGLTAADVAKSTGISKSQLSKTWHGKQRMKLKEMTALASALNVPLEELLNALGVDMGDAAQSGGHIQVSGWLDGSLQLYGAEEGAGLKGPKTAPCPFPDRDIRVARVSSAGSEHDGLDGALVYYRESKSLVKGVSPDMIGKIALVCTKGRWLLRVIRRGYVQGKFNLTSLGGKLLDEGVAIEGVHPVVWLKL